MKRFLLLSLSFCVTTAFATKSIAQTTSSLQPIKVEIVKTGEGFQLLRGGQPYFVKGAGGTSYPERIAAYGGNSMRTWGSDKGLKALDSAQKYGLTVLMGLSVTAERHGFSYDDSAAVNKQLEKLKAEVLKYKNHPALLAWGIGNELNLNYKNPKVWNAVNDIAKMIHSLDPNHPVCTVLAGANKDVIGFINTSCPDLDFLGINTYGDLAGLPKTIRSAGWAKAYMVTEWGPTGHWESLSTPWKSAIEETSSEKAAVYKTRYEYSIGRDKEKCLGSYVFLWGQKQERTPTWYGLFTEKGEETEVIDVMQYLWSGTWPANRAPHIYSLQVDGKKSVDYVYLTGGNKYKAAVAAFEPDNDKITYHWEILPEPTKLSEGGDFEARPKPIENFVVGEMNRSNITFSAPATQGAYRLFIYVSDGKNKVATANFPFYVK